MHASELVHIQYNEANGQVQVINNKPEPVTDAVARIAVYNLDGSLAYQHESKLTAAPDLATDLGPIDFPATLSSVHFIKLELRDSAGQLLSSNFYWRGQPDHPDDLTALNQLPMVTLTATAKRENNQQLTVTLSNHGKTVAVMAHLQLRQRSGKRILPVYYSDNYISLVPGESKTITIEAYLGDSVPLEAVVFVDGWNVTVEPAMFPLVSVVPNVDAQPDDWPATGLPVATSGLR
jgi:archaellum component FlaF (FlaF/FlaG flagellin family)